jgi:hypothetical protein
MNSLINLLAKARLLKGDVDLHLVRASMVIMYFFSDIRSGLITNRRA